MKISKMISALQGFMEEHGDIEAQLNLIESINPPESTDDTKIVSYPHFFMVPEQYEETPGEMTLNIREWPY